MFSEFQRISYENLVEEVEKQEYGLGYIPLVLYVQLGVCNLTKISDTL